MHSLRFCFFLVIGTLQATLAAAEDRPSEVANSLGMKFRLIPRGTFIMGVPQDEYGRLDDDAGPQHEVTLTRSFYLGIYEVTQSQYESVMGMNPSHFKDARNSFCLPVDNVTWHQAQEFCMSLSSRPEERSKRRVYRLPTEAEWEFACRAGTDTAYSFGADRRKLGEYAWYKDNSDGRTHAVGGKLPNKFGLYDMHGNVGEWCSDWWAPYPNGPTVDPIGASCGEFKVIRGATFNHWAIHNRSGNRSMHGPGVALWTIGFRVVLEVRG